MKCQRCDIEGKLYQQINTSAAVVVVERCPICRANTVPGKPFLPKEKYNWQALPIFADYSQEAHPCDYKGCTNRGTEYHHYAPRHLFPDADNWQTGWLCAEHHQRWHQMTETGAYWKGRKLNERKVPNTGIRKG